MEYLGPLKWMFPLYVAHITNANGSNDNVFAWLSSHCMIYSHFNSVQHMLQGLRASKWKLLAWRPPDRVWMQCVAVIILHSILWLIQHSLMTFIWIHFTVAWRVQERPLTNSLLRLEKPDHRVREKMICQSVLSVIMKGRWGQRYLLLCLLYLK